jgi:RNA 2',3'-cyclic 3'-phosphodiesterase
MPRLFVAVVPPDDVLDAIQALPRPVEPGVRWSRREQWHVTLRFLGEAPLGDAVDALEGLDAAPGRAEVGPAVSRLGRNVVCLPVHGLDGLAARVVEATAAVGEPPDPRPFTGHITLARLARRGTCGLAGKPFSTAFRVGQVLLIRSRLTDAGPEYTVEATRPLDRR